MMDKSYLKEIEAFADKEALVLGEPLCNHTTFRVGGKADAFLSVRNEEQLKKAIILCKEYGVPFLIIGNGSNLLVSDEGYHGMVILVGKDMADILVDGNRFKPYGKTPFSCEVKGDGRFLSIAAASILAKTYRDDYMNDIAKEYPQYGWCENKGYPTKAHRNAIREFGITPHHRKSFQLLDCQLTLF